MGPLNRYVNFSSTHANIGTWVEPFLTAILSYTILSDVCILIYFSLILAFRIFTRYL